jgi:WD40 repeat protein
LKVIDSYNFGRIQLHNVAVTPDGQRLLGVGPLLAAPNGLHPSRSTRVEKRIIGERCACLQVPWLTPPIAVFNIETRTFEKLVVFFNFSQNFSLMAFNSQTPVVNDVRDITISKRGGNVLISFEHKVRKLSRVNSFAHVISCLQTPAQLWKMELVRDARDREHPYAQIARLTLRHTYLPKVHMDFAGPSYFGGKEDQLVLCAGKGTFRSRYNRCLNTQLFGTAGDIHIWERDTATLLHYVRPQPFGGDLTCVAWNHSTDDPFMLATGSHDGTVRIWTTPVGDPSSDDASYLERRTDAGVSISDQYASSPILGPAPMPGPSRTLRERAPTIRTTFSLSQG